MVTDKNNYYKNRATNKELSERSLQNTSCHYFNKLKVFLRAGLDVSGVAELKAEFFW